MSSSPPQSARGRFLGLAMLGVAALFALAVAGVYLAASGGDDGPPQRPDNGLPFGGTPYADLPGIPTPVPGTGPLEPTRPEIGDPVPNFALADVRDRSIRKLSDFAGTPVVLNWYASWCGPCREELPAFEAAQQALGPRVAFVGINFMEGSDAATGILDETGATFPALLDPNGAVSDHYRVTGLPITMFIDAGGILRSIHRGGVTEDELADELAAIGLSYDPASPAS